MQLGLFGGTLDPIHYGHLRSAEEVRDAFGLDEIWFVPAARPPHKDPARLTSFRHRFTMAKAAVAGCGHFEVSDIEAKRSGPSYSVDTLNALRSELGQDAELYFILGSDAFVEIQTWKEYERLPELAHLVVIGRSRTCWERVVETVKRSFGAYRKANGRTAYEGPGGGLILFHQVTLLDISSSGIRRMLKGGRSVRFLMPEAVLDYIDEQGLYRE